MEGRPERAIRFWHRWIGLSPRATSWTTVLLAVLLIAFLGGLGMANARFAQSAQDANEFLPRWEGAHAWLTGGLSPYDPQVSLSAQRRLYGRGAVPAQGEDLALFDLPFPAMLLYAPWGLLDYPAARAGWMTLLEVMLVLAAVLALRLASWRPPAMLLGLLVAFSVAWAPGIRSIVAGDTAVLALVAVLASISFIERERDVAAGVLLALAMADPVVGLIALAGGLVWAATRRRWGIVGAALGTAGLLLAGSFLVMPGWPIAWLRQLTAAIQVQRDYGSQWGLLTRGAGGASGILAAALLVTAAWVLWTCLGKGTRWLLWSLTSLLALGTWLTGLIPEASSLVCLLPAVMLVLASLAQRAPRGRNWIVVVAVVLIGSGSWALYMSVSAGAGGGIVGVSVGPALAFAGMLWARWWMTRGAEVRGLSFGGRDAA
jgi:Glycosyltransferase family 87